jgi:hypothetical protein
MRERLIGHAFDDERKRVCCFHSGCIYFFLGRRIVKSLRFLDAIEFYYDQAHRGISIKAGEFIAADDPLTAGSRHFCCARVRFIDDAGFKAGSVVHFQNGNDIISRWLGLGMKTLDGRGSDRDTCEHCQSWYEKTFHRDLPILFECLKARPAGAPINGIANADGIRETAIKIFQFQSAICLPTAPALPVAMIRSSARPGDSYRSTLHEIIAARGVAF